MAAPTERWLCVAIALAAAGLAVRGYFALRGTTLSAPAAWAAIAALFFGAVEAWLALNPHMDGTLEGSLARYAAAAGAFCPLVAVLGAKRPQDRGWQCVVACLWAILLAPAGQAWVAQAGGEFELPLPWRIAWNGIALVCLLNYALTRWYIPALLTAIAQFRMSTIMSFEFDGQFEAIVLLFVAGLIVTFAPRPRRRVEATPLEAATRRWRAFRDGWGAFWALRVMNRVNETARLADWPVRLEWFGFTAVDKSAESEAIDEAQIARVQAALDSLLWRFERQS